MTALDDGLNTNSPLLLQPTIKAEWLDLPPDYSTLIGEDSIQQLGDQMGPQGLQVNQSFDDGLPDAVTMSTSSDASGSLSADLVGRAGLEATAASLVWEGSSSQSGTGTVIAPTWPTTMGFLDYHLIAIMVDADTTVKETTVSTWDRGGWKVLGDTNDGGYRTFLFGRQHYPSAGLPSFTANKSVAWTAVSALVRAAKTQSGAIVAVTPGRPEYTPQLSGASTLHTTPLVQQTGKGWVLGVFGCPAANAPWTSAGGSIGVVSQTGSTTALTMRRTDLMTMPQKDVAVQANTNTATDVVTLIAVPLIVRERPMLDASAYFSPYNQFSPIVGWERDTAPVTGSINVVTPTGPVATQVFKGVMADIPVSSRSATLQAVSATRLKLDKSFTVPTVNGWREGATTDWLASFLMAQGGQYIGPKPTRNTRFWAPLHGSLHPHMDGPASFASAYYYDTSRTAGTAYTKRPRVVDSLFGTGIGAQMTNAYVEHLSIVNDPNWATDVPGIDNPLTYDLLSKLNGRGRLSFYIKCDPNTAVPAALAGADPYLFAFTLYNLDANGNSTNFIQFKIRGDRQYDHTLVNTASAVGGLTLPTDGSWQFMGFAWDYVAGTTMGKRGGLNWSTNSHSTSLDQLPASTANLYALGRFTNLFIQSRLPISDIDVSIGPETYTGSGTTTWENWRGPTSYTDPPRNATFRPTKTPLAAIAEPSPVQGWSKLTEVAQSTLSAMRLNEEDNLEFVPLSYFGETAQMTVGTANILDTAINAADVDIELDASRIRNIVTSEYEEVRVDMSRSSVLEVTSPITIPRGESFQTFALDTQIAEVHGAALWQSTTPDIQTLTATQISGAATIQNEHVMTPNIYSDGSTAGQRSTSSFKARVVSYDNSSVTIRFRNNLPVTMYLANNGNQIPVLRILGYPIRRTDAYTTMRDAGSVGLRRERGLTASLPWIQDRDSAEAITTSLVGITARPRPQVSITVMGDPRRRPGQLTRLVDATGTAVAGTWRILACTHRQVGAMYVNDLSLVGVGDVGVWDVSYWDQVVWGV